MLDGLAAAIRRDRQEWVIKEERQAIVNIIQDAIKPASLNRAVAEKMVLSRNKPLKKDVYRFVRWLREFAIGHERFVGFEEESKPVVKSEAPKVSLGGAKQPPAAAQPPPKAPVAAPPADVPPGRRFGSGCLKCNSTSHRVRECPGITREEASRLLKAHGRSPGRGRNENQRDPGTPGGRVATVRVDTKKQDRPGLLTVVDGIVSVQASLLDSGADLSVVSGGLVSALLAAGASPDITVMGPMVLRPYGTDSKPITVTKQVRLGSLEFKTACGSLLLRGLRVWVDEAEPNVELTLGLPVMKTLGYDEQTLLENARKQQAVWELQTRR
ncbi:hypothetical protein DYB32_008019 [Aphanomyces invadans]|uniref:Peptidase A2 domain-containing protein n=1 Tax=Aphanomyces invadans TaxID=157072 RepID=A0A3R6ZKT7_9STRA|nr:hypothetical protein DYB32_008019 [Aphanomyces invadans]